MTDAPYHGFTVMVRGPDGRVGGLGALVGPQQIVTCAHVVNTALGLDQRTQDRPAGVLRITFPLLPSSSASSLRASVAMWRQPPRPGAAGDDIAGLVIEASETLPPGATPGLLAADLPRPGSQVSVFGYPVSPPRPAGSLVSVIVRGVVAGGRLQLDSGAESALRVQAGFSGSPVFDDSIGRIVGLVSQADTGTQGNDSYAVGTGLLRSAWPRVLGDRPSSSQRARSELTILHISNPRFAGSDVIDEGAASSSDAALSRDALSGQLYRDIRELAVEHGVRPDLLVMTGGLADGGLPGEYRHGIDFMSALAGSTGIPRRHVAIIPGSHDVNRLACQAHFITQASRQQQPIPPYFPKWGEFATAFKDFYGGVDDVTFTPDEPWTLFEVPDLHVVIAGLNSTMAESHLDVDHSGVVGQAQLNWFAARLAEYRIQGWLRIAAIHHDVLGLRDVEDLDNLLGSSGLVNVFISGQQRRSGRLTSGVPALGIADLRNQDNVAGQYEMFTIDASDIRRYIRQYTDGRWRSSTTRGLENVHHPIADAEAVLGSARHSPFAPDGAAPGDSAGRDMYIAGRDMHFNSPSTEALSADNSFLSRVAEASRLRFPKAAVSEHVLNDVLYLRVSDPVDGVRPVGVIDGPATPESLAAFFENVHTQFAAADPQVRSEFVYTSPAAAATLVTHARRQGIRLRSFIEYQGLLDLRPLADAQRDRLEADRIYPARLYVDQRYTVVSGNDHRNEVHRGLIDQATEWLRADVARLVVVLGDFGRGKTSFLRQLTRLLPTELPDVTPILVELRNLEKGPTLDDLLAQHLVREGVNDVSKDKLRYMIDRGRVALLFDGFDELELRVGYDSAGEYLQTLLNSLTGQAKVILTSRTQHFRSTHEVRSAVRTALGERVETRTGSRVAILEDFAEDQILTFLTNLYGGDEQRARLRFELIGHIANLLELTRNPRMLAFVAQLDDRRLLAVRAEGGQLSAAGLYEEIIDYWLAKEEDRQRHRRGLEVLSKDERFAVCTKLALRLWQTNQPTISLHDLSAEVTATLKRLAERGFSDEQAAHSIASGSLLVRTDDDAFMFVHQSVMEWLVAANAARDLAAGAAGPVLGIRPMSRLMAAFFADLADYTTARQWAADTLTDQQASEAAKQNALAVWTVITRDEAIPVAPPVHQNLAGVDMRNQDMNSRDLRGANLRGAVLRGMRLSGTDLSGADLTAADLTDVVMTKGSLHGTVLTRSRWHRAALLGTEGALESRLAGHSELGAAAIAGQDRAEIVTEMPSGEARCVAFSPDGALLALGSGNVAKIADVATGRVLRVLRGHQGVVTAIAYSPDGTVVATASGDWTARTWDTSTGVNQRTFHGHSDSVNSVAFSRGGSLIATASSDGTVRTWDAGTGAHRTTLTGHRGSVHALAFSPDSALIATASDDRAVRIWDVLTGARRSTLARHTGDVYGVAFSPDGTLLASASADGTARTWDPATGLQRTTLAGHAKPVRAVAFSPDGSLIATASDDGTVRTWDAAAGTNRVTFTGHGSRVNAIAFAPNGALIATASDDRTTRTWDAATGTPRTELAGHGSPVNAIAFSPDGKLLATASDDRTARTWDTTTGVRRATITGHDLSVTAIAFSPDGALTATGSWDRTARIWDAASGAHVTTLSGHGDWVTAVTFSANSSTVIATASDDRTARTWDVSTGAHRMTFIGHESGVNAVAFSPDGALIATASRDRTARIWNASTGKQRNILTGHDDWVTAVTFSPLGTQIATASHDRVVRLWRVTDTSGSRVPRLLPTSNEQSPTVTLSGHQASVRDVAFSPNGAWLASASDDGTARIWSVKGGPARLTFTGHDGPVKAVTFSPSGALIATASEDGTVRIWDAETASAVATLIPLLNLGYATLLPDGAYKLDGDPGDRLWWAMKLRRFGPGELDPFVPEIRRLHEAEPILPHR